MKIVHWRITNPGSGKPKFNENVGTIIADTNHLELKNYEEYLKMALKKGQRSKNHSILEIPLYHLYDYDNRLRLLQGVHVIQSSIVKGRRILLFDDLYRSVATMNTITAELYGHGLAADVFALAITRTRSKS